jgi:choline dehydrogenase
MNRRDFIRLSAALGIVRGGATADARETVPGSQPAPTGRSGRTSRPAVSQSPPSAGSGPLRADYVVVGSGAGGGTVAARLVEAGYSVVVLEAGGDPERITGSDPLHPGIDTYPEDYEVPAFHPLATENDAIRWDFFVRHYKDDEQQRRDRKFVKDHNGKPVNAIWYPRAGALGGCTTHNAMIFIYPHNTDWNQLADLTGDASWRAEHMRSYFERLEKCRYRPWQRFWSRLGVNPTRHGWGGWLHAEKPEPKEAIRDPQVREALSASFAAQLKELGLPSFERLESLGDPNDWRRVETHEVGACYVPLTSRDFRRLGTRERLLETHRKYPDRLTIETSALAASIRFDGSRAVGVDYLKGDHLYAADPKCTGQPGEPRTAFANREVILAGGAFNTPQLLMLSGIGPTDALDKASIKLRVPLAGVGRNLQDRYEVAVVNQTRKPWDSLDGATFSKSDRQYAAWTQREGVYITNGVLLSVIARSDAKQPVPDLFCYAVLADFRGYEPGYSTSLQKTHSALTWVVLKAHTGNTGGCVTLRSADPRDTPSINFHYFHEGTDPGGPDLEAVVNGVHLVRRLTRPLVGRVVDAEVCPGPDYNTDEKLREFVRDQAWGHHASCTCAIGPKDRGGVLSSDFRVHDTVGLRVVDASVFPRAPGLFIISAVYMIGEKAADVIVADAKRNTPAPRS